MTKDSLKIQLDDAKERFLKAQTDMKNYRQKIAEISCPLKIGDLVSVTKDGKDFEGVIEHIYPATKSEEMIQPVIGIETGWAVSGSRMNKTTQELGKWTFAINSFDYELQGKTWVLSIHTLNDIFGTE